MPGVRVKYLAFPLFLRVLSSKMVLVMGKQAKDVQVHYYETNETIKVHRTDR